MSTTRIGFFDSGIGGISVLSYARRRLPAADCIYYADTDHVPYGTKTREEIIRYSDAAVGFLAEQGVSAVVVACNTATSMAITYLREKYPFPIVGMEPAVKPAAVTHQGERILVCATPVTIAGEKLHNLIRMNYASGELPDLVGLPGLVTFAEEGMFEKETVCRYLETVIDRRDYSAVVLGCTHFGYFRDSFRELLGDIDLIDGTEGTVNRLISVMAEENIAVPDAGQGSLTFYQTGRSVTDPSTLAFYDTLLARAENLT